MTPLRLVWRSLRFGFGAVIAFTVDANRVAILGTFRGGQDYEVALEAGDMD